MSFNALVQDGKVYLIPGALDVPASHRGAVVPVVVLGSWESVPPPPAPVVVAAPMVAVEPVAAVVEAAPAASPAEAPAAPVEAPAEDPSASSADLPSVSSRSERRKGR
jgi:hypothetical protein